MAAGFFEPLISRVIVQPSFDPALLTIVRFTRNRPQVLRASVRGLLEASLRLQGWRMVIRIAEFGHRSCA